MSRSETPSGSIYCSISLRPSIVSSFSTFKSKSKMPRDLASKISCFSISSTSCTFLTLYAAFSVLISTSITALNLPTICSVDVWPDSSSFTLPVRDCQIDLLAPRDWPRLRSYWLNGDYFCSTEVIFSRSLLYHRR